MSFLKRFTSDEKNAEKFFKVFNDRMKEAQQEIKANILTNVNSEPLGGSADKEEPVRKGISYHIYIISKHISLPTPPLPYQVYLLSPIQSITSPTTLSNTSVRPPSLPSPPN